MIVAMDKRGAIGKAGDLPWHLKDDLKFFKQQTLGHSLIMGRRTYQSIGRPLPGRKTIILSRSKSFDAKGCKVASTLDEAIEAVDMGDPIIAGGGEIYRLGIDRADKLIITHVDTVVDGDTFFPAFDPSVWHSLKETKIMDRLTGTGLRFVEYSRKSG